MSALGRVEDVDEWIRLSSDCLERFSGKSLFEETSLSSATEIDENERFAVLSHGTQSDPVYN